MRKYLFFEPFDLTQDYNSSAQ